jgi:hypothetical protein
MSERDKKIERKKLQPIENINSDKFPLNNINVIKQSACHPSPTQIVNSTTNEKRLYNALQNKSWLSADEIGTNIFQNELINFNTTLFFVAIHP